MSTSTGTRVRHVQVERGIAARMARVVGSPWLWVAGLVALGFLLRRFHLGAESLWFDEADLVAQSRQPLGNLFEAFTRAGENGPLYNLVFHFWVVIYDGVPWAARLMHLLFGTSYEAPLRGLAMLFGTAGIPAIYALARKLGGTGLGLVSAALLTLNPFHIWYSQDAKMYSLLVLMTILTTWLYLLALERNTPALWLLYVVATWVMLTSHSLSGLVLLAQVTATPLLLRNVDRGAASEAGEAEAADETSRVSGRVPHWAWAFGLIVLPVLPIIWLRAAALVTGTIESGDWYATATLPDILLTIFVKFALNQAAPGELFGLTVPWEGIGALVMGGLALLGAWVLSRRRGGSAGQQPAILLFWLIPVGVFWLLTIAVPLFHPRYLIMALPPYLMMAAAGILALRRLNPLLMAVPLVLLPLSTGAALASINYSDVAQKEDWRGAMSYVQDHIRLRDVIVPFPGYLQSAVNLYYEPGGPGLVPDRPVGTITNLRTEDYGPRQMQEELRRIAECNERAWLIVSPVRADAEDPTHEVLQWFQGSFYTFDTKVFNGVTVYGIAFNTVFNCWSPNPDYLEPHTFENGLEFLGYIYELRDDDSTPTQPDASYLPLTLFWRSGADMTEDYEIVVRVIAPTGEVVKEDTLGPMNGYFPTSRWPTGFSLMDYRDVRLPGGLTPGDYTVTVQVHPQGHPDGALKLVGESGNTITFGQPLKVVPWQP